MIGGTGESYTHSDIAMERPKIISEMIRIEIDTRPSSASGGSDNQP